jgi:hypothetical protein
MVAPKSTVASYFMPPPEPFVAGRWRIARFTRSDAEALVRAGIVPEDASTELLDGLVVLKDRSARDQDPTMIGQDHRKCVEKFSALRTAIDGAQRHVESQQPLVCSEIHVPEPDFMVLRGTLNDYTELPTAADAYCVVEVADSSYERDIGEKLVGYAKAGVVQYIVINLRNRMADVYTNPDGVAGKYAPAQIVRAGEVLSLRVGEQEFFQIALGELLP